MAINLAPQLKQNFLDGNGFPLQGGKLYTYLAGTASPADTYTDSTGGTLNTNPIILDERGEADVWLSSALVYKFVLKSSDGSTIYTVDNVSSGSGAGGSSGGELVKISAADIAAQYLENKLVAGQDISITKLNTGAVEQLEIASTLDITKFVTVDTTQRITGNKDFDGINKFGGSVRIESTSPFYVLNNRIRFDTSGTEYGWIGTNGTTDVRIDVSNGAELLTNNTPASADSITNKAYVDGEIAAKSTQNAGNSTIWTYKGLDNTRTDPFFNLSQGEFILWRPSGNPQNLIYLIINPTGLDGIDYSLAFNNITHSSVISIQDPTNNNYKFSQDLSMGSPLPTGDYFFGWWNNGVLYDAFTANVAIDTPCVLNFDVRREEPAPPTAGGSDTQIQYNDNGIFNGIPSLSYEVNNSTPNGTTPVYARYPFVWNRTVMVDDEISLLDALEWISVDTILIGAGSFVQNYNNIPINNGDKSIEILGNNYLDLSNDINFTGSNSLRIYGKVTFNSIPSNAISLQSDVYIKELSGGQTTINFIGAGTLYYESFDGGDAPAGWTGNITKQHWSEGKPAPSSDQNNSFTYGSDGLPFVEGNSTVYVEVNNGEATAITRGQPVYVSGATGGGTPIVSLADNNVVGKNPAIGLVADNSIASGGDGQVLISGILENVDTSPYTIGDALYLDNTVGNITNVRPLGTSEQVQKVGLVTRVDLNAGKILVIGAGRSNDVPNELTTLTGVPLDATDLGTFTGSVIANNQTIKDAFQDVENGIEALDLDTVLTQGNTSTQDATFGSVNVGDVLNIDTAGSFYASTGGYSGVVLDKPLLLNHQSSPALVFNAADGANTAAYMLYSTGGQALTIKNGNSQIDLVENGNYSFGGDGTTKTSLQTSIDGVHGTNYATLKLAARDNTGGYGYAEVEINSGDSTNGAVPSFVNLVGEEVRVNGTPIDFTNYANIAYTNVANIFTQSQTIKSGNGTQNLIIKNDANANVIELWSDTDGDGYAAFKDSGGTDVVLIDTDSSSGYAMKVTGSQELTGELIMTSPSARIRNDDDTGFLQMTGSKDNVTGANILLYGASNVTDTKGRLRYDTTTKLLWDADSVDVQAFDFSVDTDTLFVDASTDRVGIGTSSPLDALHISASSGDARMILDGASGSDSEIKFYEAGTAKYAIGHDAPSGNFIIGTTNVETGQRLAIDSSGNVGIGTSSPSAKLHVNGGRSRFQQNGTNTLFYGTDHTYLAFHPKGAGREGYFGYSAASTDRLTIMNENASSLDLGTNSSTRVRIDSAGNVGIGTTSPSAKLDVDGDTTVSGDLVVTGNINVRIGTTTSTASLSIDTDLYDQYNVTALATTMAVQAPTNGLDGKKLIIRITDDGTARSISFPGLTAVGVTFPNTTQGNSAKTIYIGCIYNGQQSRWDAIAVAEEA